jgi:hypothetical protein
MKVKLDQLDLVSVVLEIQTEAWSPEPLIDDEEVSVESCHLCCTSLHLLGSTRARLSY